MTYGYQAMQVGDLPRKVPTLKATCPYCHVTNMRSLVKFKNLYVNFHKTYV